MSASAKPIANTRSGTGIPTARLITWWVIASEIVIFGGLLATYIMHRFGASGMGGGRIAHATPGRARSILSCFSRRACAPCWLTRPRTRTTAQGREIAAPDCARRIDLPDASRDLNGPRDIHEGFVLSSGGFWSFYYTLAGLHGLHVLAGMIIMLIVAADAAKNQELQRVECIGLYWHFVDIVWIFLFPLLYIAR